MTISLFILFIEDRVTSNLQELKDLKGLLHTLKYNLGYIGTTLSIHLSVHLPVCSSVHISCNGDPLINCSRVFFFKEILQEG